MKHQVIRGIYTGSVCLLWCIVMVMVLEGAALFYQMYMERTNTLIAGYRAGLPYPETSALLKLKQVDPIYPPALGGWEPVPTPFTLDADMEQVLDWGPPHPGIPTTQRMAHREVFSGLSSDARETYARLGKEMVLVFGDGHRIDTVYGSDKFFFTGIQRLLFFAVLSRTNMQEVVRRHLDDALTSGQSQEFQLHWPNPETPAATLSAVCIPAARDRNDGERAYLFVSLHPDEIASGQGSQPFGVSRWEREHFRFKPDYRSDAHPEFTTNSRGFRDVERQIPKPDDVFRILCLGGSTTQEGNSNESTYPALLEARLNEAFPGHVIEVVNAGIPGIATPGHLLRFPDYAALEPDLVIMHLGVNDTLLNYNSWLVNVLPAHLRSVRLFAPSLFAPSLNDFMKFHSEYMGRNLELLAEMFQRRGTAVALASMAWPDPNSLNRDAAQFYAYQGKYTWEFPAFCLRTYGQYIQASNDILREKAVKMHAIYIPVAERIQRGDATFTDFCHMTQNGIEAKSMCMYESLHPLFLSRFNTTGKH